MKGLYAIIDPEHCRGRDPLAVAEAVLAGGCAALQLRAKQLPDRDKLALAQALAHRCLAARIPFWLNDRLDLALLVEADGVHLGQDDIPLSEARRLWPNRMLGLSTHDLAQAQAAFAQGADAIGFGPVFSTTSKKNPDPCVGLDGLRAVCRAVPIPVIAIGGIDARAAADVAATGAAYAAAISALCAADDPGEAARIFHRALTEQDT